MIKNPTIIQTIIDDETAHKLYHSLLKAIPVRFRKDIIQNFNNNEISRNIY